RSATGSAATGGSAGASAGAVTGSAGAATAVSGAVGAASCASSGRLAAPASTMPVSIRNAILPGLAAMVTPTPVRGTRINELHNSKTPENRRLTLLNHAVIIARSVAPMIGVAAQNGR